MNQLYNLNFKLNEMQDDPTLFTTLKGHKDTITALSFHPGLKSIASSANDGVVSVWQLKQPRKVYRFMGHKGQVSDVQFSPNGLLIASFEGSSVSIKAHSAPVRSVQFSCDGQLLVSSSDDKSVKVWSVNDRKFQYGFQHTNWVRSAVFSQDVRLIASGGDDRAVIIWDCDSKKEAQRYNEHIGVVYKVQFSPDSTILGSCSHDKKLKLFDVRSKRVIQHYDAHADSVLDLKFHPSGQFAMTSGADSKVKVWDLRMGKLAYTLYGHNGQATTCAFSNHGDYFATGGSDSMILVWNTNWVCSGQESLDEKPKQVKSKPTQQSLTQGQQQSSQQKENVQQTNSQLPKQKETVLYSNADNSLHKKSEFNQSVQLQKEDVPAEVITQLDNISGQLELITRTLQALEQRVSNNEQQICRLNLALTRDFERSEQIQNQIYDLRPLEEQVQDQDEEENVNYIKFHRAANN
ncbi:unnamed protein product (macronuclear) [Paramecium tetraurelia]|uniref:Uncharacterized protein n=1 Tax=Paramecium tetraurelia TaxID=5888 RepID=A0D524_PARTE|nr:uncharacterized protein GSPATT00013588001 [Paramecium tetraurelia]CAK78141.1 unnamed protein product [Paramecium tetraurelia]|eukprot:XP_001445538.1 hypothetical protein (macronuclear) [Paramecium tetraurelia strain d4-2]